MLEGWVPQIPWLGAFGHPVILPRAQPCSFKDKLSRPICRIFLNITPMEKMARSDEGNENRIKETN